MSGGRKPDPVPSDTTASSSAPASPERLKLAHTLDVDPERLRMLTAVPDEDIRTLRKQIDEALFQADRHHFARVAALAKAVPAAVAAKLVEVTLPPLVAARTAELIEPARAVEMVGRISDRYLADVSAVMDASRAPEVVAAIPGERVATVGLELARREQWIVIGGFVAQVSDEALRASTAAFTGEHLLRISYVLDEPSRLDDIGALLTDTQIDDMLAAATTQAMWVELAALIDQLSAERQARLAARFAVAPESLWSAYEDAVAAGLLDAGAYAHLSGA